MPLRLSTVLIRVASFVVAALLSYFAALAVVAVVENRSVISVQESLIDDDQSWATVLGDGLQVIIEGRAPSEAARFRSISIAGSIVDASRVIDNMSIADNEGITAPEFAIEILRNDSGVSLIGLIPSASDRADISERIAEIASGKPVNDLLEIADFPMPEGWRQALTFAIRALAILPRSKISVAPGLVEVTAISDSPEQKLELESNLRALAPAAVELTMSISAPRPVITPFTTRFSLDAEGAKFDACAADTTEAAAQIEAAARAAGLEDDFDCTIALGVPSGFWADAVEMSIQSVYRLGGGTVTLSDADISLVALEGTPQDLFDTVVGEFENALPDIFSLTAALPVAPEAAPEGVPQFSATLSPEGHAQLRGRVPDDLTNMMVENYAKARFGQSNLTMGTRVVEGLPRGWSVRVLAGLEALSMLTNGSVIVQPDLVAVRGNTTSADTTSEISRLFIEKLGQSAEFTVDLKVVEQFVEVETGPTPEACVAEILAVTGDRKIIFDPGSATLTAESRLILDDISVVLRDCMDAPIEVAGYTDSQGREEMNKNLSQSRAEAVLSALRSRRVLTGSFRAVGYGEADPIADNDTEEGREANRRIEFRVYALEEDATTTGEPPAEEAPQAETPADDSAAGTEG